MHDWDKSTARVCANKLEAESRYPQLAISLMRTIQNARPGSTSTFGFTGSVAFDTTTDDVSLISTS